MVGMSGKLLDWLVGHWGATSAAVACKGTNPDKSAVTEMGWIGHMGRGAAAFKRMSSPTSEWIREDEVAATDILFGRAMVDGADGCLDVNPTGGADDAWMAESRESG